MFSLPTLKVKKVATNIFAPELLISVPCLETTAPRSSKYCRVVELTAEYIYYW